MKTERRMHLKSSLDQYLTALDLSYVIVDIVLRKHDASLGKTAQPRNHDPDQLSEYHSLMNLLEGSLWSFDESFLSISVSRKNISIHFQLDV